jgi:hypothetical protein
MNWTDKRGEPLSRFPGSNWGGKSGRTIMDKKEILIVWLSSKLATVYDMCEEFGFREDCSTISSKDPSYFSEMIDKAPDWFCASDGCKTYQEWIIKHPGTAKPFHFDFSPARQPQSVIDLRIVHYDAGRLLKLLEKVEILSIEKDDFIMIEWAVRTLAFLRGECSGWSSQWAQKKDQYINGPGETSRSAGQWTLNEVVKVLEKYGGITGYKALPRGKKKPVRDEIEERIKAKDPRNVHILLNKLKSKKEN